MLQKVLDLAKTGYTAKLNDCRNAFTKRLADIGNQQISGAQIGKQMREAAGEEVKNRSAIAAAEIKRAVDSYDLRGRVFANDLLDAFEKLTSNEFGDVRANVIEKMKFHAPNLEGAIRDLDEIMLGARITGRQTAKAELEHLAAKQHSPYGGL